ncbi:MAG: hypothetical protein R2828_08090 [Saprospiraceae bacterium]
MKVIKNSSNKFSTLQKAASRNLIAKGSDTKKNLFKHVTLQKDVTSSVKGGWTGVDLQGL